MELFDKCKNQDNDAGHPTRGWDAITARFEQLYPGQTNPNHYGTLISYALGGNDPLDGISIYDGGDFWHFVTYGFSELYEKNSENDSEWSGFGFELTFKLKKLSWIDESEIKNIAGVLQSLARYVFSSQRGFKPYEYIWTKQTEGFDCNGKSKLTGFATAPDEAGLIETPNGKVEFICVVGLTDKELQKIANKEASTKIILEKIGNTLTDYERNEVV
ncbi:MAG: suppressor of fused domain protein [Sporomusaceae bacterium]|nr:suppressor of fused domain protein [Sporomusaceae bacterium]